MAKFTSQSLQTKALRTLRGSSQIQFITAENIKTKNQQADWIKTVTITLFTTVVTTVLNYYVWFKQFLIGKNQTLYEHRLSALDNLTKDGNRMIVLEGYKERLMFEEAKIESKLLHGNVTGLLTGDTVLSLNKRNEVILQLKKTFPVEYENYLKAIEFQVEFKSSGLSIANFFDKPSVDELVKLGDVMGQKHFQLTLLSQIQIHKGDIQAVNSDLLINNLIEERENQLAITEQVMSNQLLKE